MENKDRSLTLICLLVDVVGRLHKSCSPALLTSSFSPPQPLVGDLADPTARFGTFHGQIWQLLLTDSAVPTLVSQPKFLQQPSPHSTSTPNPIVDLTNTRSREFSQSPKAEGP